MQAGVGSEGGGVEVASGDAFLSCTVPKVPSDGGLNPVINIHSVTMVGSCPETLRSQTCWVRIQLYHFSSNLTVILGNRMSLSFI